MKFIKLKKGGYKGTEFIDRFDVMQKGMNEDFDIVAIGLDGRPFAVEGYKTRQEAEDELDELIKRIEA